MTSKFKRISKPELAPLLLQRRNLLKRVEELQEKLEAAHMELTAAKRALEEYKSQAAAKEAALPRPEL